MDNYLDAKKNLKSHLTSAEMALRIKDYKEAYLDYLAAGEDSALLATLTLDKKESEMARKLSEEYKASGEECLSKLHLSPAEKEKLKPRKKPKGFCEFIGRDDIKEYLTKNIVEPWKNGTYPEKESLGLLIYGPNGCAKSVLVQSLVHELGATEYYVEPRENFSVYNARNVLSHWDALLKKAEEKNNIVFFFTHAEAYFPKGDDEESKKTVKRFYSILNKERKKIRSKKLNILFVLGTSVPEKVDVSIFEKKFLHPVLFTDIIRIHHPNTLTRKERRKERLANVDIEDPTLLDDLAKATHGFVSKKVSDVCRSLNKRANIYQGDRVTPLLTRERAEKVRKDHPYVPDTTFKEGAEAFEKSLSSNIKVFGK